MTGPVVADYMIRDVLTVSPSMTVGQVRDIIISSSFHGFPIAEKGYLLGFITAKELLKHINTPDAKMREVMNRGTLCAVPSMAIEDATRILFRYGLRNLPVIDENRKLVGIISNIDIVRSQIEKARPGKVMTVKKFLEQQNGIRMRVVNKDVRMDQLLPSQKEVYKLFQVSKTFKLFVLFLKGLNVLLTWKS